MFDLETMICFTYVHLPAKIMTVLESKIRRINYCFDPKFSGRQVLATYVDPDQQEQSDQGLHSLTFELHVWTHKSVVNSYC